MVSANAIAALRVAKALFSPLLNNSIKNFS
jgi:hypothetical protein